MCQWRAVDVHSGGVEAQNGAREGMLTSGRRFITLMSIRIRIDFGLLDSVPGPTKVKYIRKKVKKFHVLKCWMFSLRAEGFTES
jgi:hypothetical protein